MLQKSSADDCLLLTSFFTGARITLTEYNKMLMRKPYFRPQQRACAKAASVRGWVEYKGYRL